MAAKKRKAQTQLILERKDTIGEPGAEDDIELLSKCFIPNPAFDMMKNIENRKSILIGGTGAGKTAIIEQFCRENPKNCVRLSLNDVSLNYLSNSNIINSLEEIDIKLGVLYQTLWKHFLVIQLLKKKSDNYTKTGKKNFITSVTDILKSSVTDILKGNVQSKISEYLDELEDDFWLEPNECIQKNTEEMIRILEGSVGLKGIGSLDVKQIKSDKIEFQKIQKAIDHNKIQILSKIFDVLDDEIFTDAQNPFFIFIDELDTDWVIKQRKYQLIRALIETIKAFRNIKNVKIIIALRTDLYDRIISATRDEGFQQEKYQTYLLPLHWDKGELYELVNKRISEVFKSRYTSQSVIFNDIAPEKINDTKCFDYLYERTFQRPRHIIMFINTCILESVGKNKFTQTSVKEAEKEYSSQRLEAIKDEWGESYGFIEQSLEMLQEIGRSNFEISSISEELILGVALEINNATNVSEFDTKLKKHAAEVFFREPLTEKFLANLFKMLYQIGIVGIKLGPSKTYSWYFGNNQSLSAGKIKLDTSVKIHPMFWETLGISSRKS